MKIKNGFAKRDIAGSTIVVPVGSTAKEFNGMITLNDTGSFIWDCFLKDISIDEAVEAVLAEYDVEREKAQVDVERFVNMLKENGIIE